jgi:Family of unknown function (DUF6152)
MNSAVLSLILAFAMHHSISGVYDSSRQVTVEGVIAEFHFVNPHPFIVVDANNERWKMEMDNLSELVEVGMTKFTLKPGDRVVVSGKPARSTPPQSLYIMKLDRPADGFRYEQVGTSPRVHFPGK